MKTYSISQMVLACCAGLVVGVVATVVVYSFISTGTEEFPGTSVSADEAKAYYEKYMASPDTVCDTIKAFNVTKEQLGAMNDISSSYRDPSNPLMSFRIYKGVDASGASISILVGVDGTNKDQPSEIRTTAWGTSGLCPTVCDPSSPVVGH
jgi:hypothetical protein